MSKAFGQLDSFDLAHLRQFSYVGEDLHRSCIQEVLNVLIDDTLPESTNSLLSQLLGFLCAFVAFVVSCVCRDNHTSMEGNIPQFGAMVVVVFLVVCHFFLTRVSDRKAQEKGQNTALYIFVRYGLSAPSTGFLTGVFCYCCGIKSSNVCFVFCAVQCAFYAMHWCHFFTRCFHELFLQLDLISFVLVFFLLGTMITGNSLDDTASLVLKGLYGVAAIFVLVQIISVSRLVSSHGRSHMTPSIRLFPVLFYAALCMFWSSQSDTAFESHTFFFVQCFIWFFSFMAQQLIVCDIVECVPHLFSWPLVCLIICTVNAFLGWIDPALMAIFMSFVAFCGDMIYFVMTVLSLHEYLIQHPETPLSFYRTD